MLLSLIFSQPMLALAWLSALMIAFTGHEFSHALVGKWRGDNTAEEHGRLTLNPLAHLDLLGFLMLISVGFGWGKPVPFNPRNLKNPLQDGLMIAMAGPGSNLIMAIMAGGVYRLLLVVNPASLSTMLGAFLIVSIIVNLFLMIFNLLPIYPLDGSKVLDLLMINTRYEYIRQWLNVNGAKILIVLVVLSLLTPLNVFAFLQAPTYGACSALIGHSCINLLGVYFGG